MTKVAFDKFCICFVPDSDTLKVIGGMHTKIASKYPELIRPGTGPGLPYHMTIIGGIKLEPNVSKSLIQNAVSQIMPFSDSNKIPILKDLEVAQMYGGYLAIRLKLEQYSYVITGSPEKNRGLASSLRVANFNFDSIRHISLCKVLGRYIEMDKVKIFFDELFKGNKDALLNMKLTPKVFIMPANQKSWQLYPTR